MALVRSVPFQEADQVLQAFLRRGGRESAPLQMPMDAWRTGDRFVVEIDLPGMAVESIDVSIDNNVVEIRAERRSKRADVAEVLVLERPEGVFNRQITLGEHLDGDHLEASYEAGVLTLTVPIAPHSRARRIDVTARSPHTG